MLEKIKKFLNLTSNQPLISAEEQERINKMKAFEKRVDSLLDSCAYDTVANMIDNGHELSKKQVRNYFITFSKHFPLIDMDKWFVLSDSIIKQNKKNKDTLFYSVALLMSTVRLSPLYEEEIKDKEKLKSIDSGFINSLTYVPFMIKFIAHYEKELVSHFNYDQFLVLLEGAKNIGKYTVIRDYEPLVNLMIQIEKNHYHNAKEALISEMKEIYQIGTEQSIEEKIKHIHQEKSKQLFMPQMLNDKLLEVYNQIQKQIDFILNNTHNESILKSLDLEDKKSFENLINRDLPEILAAFTSLPDSVKNTEKTQTLFEENLQLIYEKLNSISSHYANNQIEKLEVKKQYLKSSI
jgi:hypothetical protein